MIRRYAVDRRVRLLERGRVVIGGDPVRLMRLTEVGAANITAWVADGLDAIAPTAAVSALIDRLVDSAVLHPFASGSERPTPPVVVPVRDRPDALGRCLGALIASGVGDIVVVDDGSIDADAHRRIADEFDAELVRRDGPGGPSAARRAGVAAVRGRAGVGRRTDSELVAFVDSDVEVAIDWLDPIMGLFDDDRVALVAPRVRHRTGRRLVDRFEAYRSPLDLGADPAPIVAGTRVSYVPAAALVVRVAPFEEIGGFDVDMEVGEDVDLVWRLGAAGWRCRYEPRSEVVHVGRSKWAPLLHRRFDYGRSAAALDERHPGELAAVVGSPWSFAVVTLAAVGHPVLAGATVASTSWTLRRRLESLSAHGEPTRSTVAARLVLTGHLSVARQIARATVRPWFPVSLIGGALLTAAGPRGRSLRRALSVAAVAGPLEEWVRRRPAIDPARWVAMCLADDLAYSVGVWAGCLGGRRPGPLLPRWRTRTEPR